MNIIKGKNMWWQNALLIWAALLIALVVGRVLVVAVIWPLIEQMRNRRGR